MNRHSMGLVKLCFGWQGKTAHITWTQGKELIYLLPPLLVKPKEREPQPCPSRRRTWLDTHPFLFPIPSLQLWQPDTQKHRSWDTHRHGFAQKHRKVRTPQCPGDKYAGKKKIGGG